jgi:photosystem II stability/assembly factor-like uncharacterized protein
MSVPDAEKLDFRDIHAFGEMSAVVMASGDAGRFYKTTNGGRSWSLRYSNDTKGVFFDAMAFWDDKHGIAFSDPIDGHLLVVTTDDAGNSWQVVPADRLPETLPGEAAFAASGTCLAIEGKSNVWIATGGAETSRVFRSTDRGRTWSVSETPVKAGSASTGIFSITFWDSNNGVAVGGNYQEPTHAVDNVAVTTDGGKTWTKVTGTPPSGYRSCVAYVPGAKTPTLVAVGISGTDISTNGGISWTKLDGANLNSVAFSPSGSGWGVGPEGLVGAFRGMGDGDVSRLRR